MKFEAATVIALSLLSSAAALNCNVNNFEKDMSTKPKSASMKNKETFCIVGTVCVDTKGEKTPCTIKTTTLYAYMGLSGYETCDDIKDSFETQLPGMYSKVSCCTTNNCNTKKLSDADVDWQSYHGKKASAKTDKKDDDSKDDSEDSTDEDDSEDDSEDDEEREDVTDAKAATEKAKAEKAKADALAKAKVDALENAKSDASLKNTASGQKAADTPATPDTNTAKPTAPTAPTTVDNKPAPTVPEKLTLNKLETTPTPTETSMGTKLIPAAIGISTLMFALWA